jgi:DNA-binding transcriptional MerR regulator
VRLTRTLGSVRGAVSNGGPYRDQLEPWLEAREKMPVGPLFCVINGRTCGRAWRASAARAALRRRAARAGVRRRFAPHQLRHAHALELLREGVPLNIIQRQLGHRNLGVTSIYLQGIDPEEIIETVRARRSPMIPASLGLALPRRRWPRAVTALAALRAAAARPQSGHNRQRSRPLLLRREKQQWTVAGAWLGRRPSSTGGRRQPPCRCRRSRASIAP